MNPSDIDSATLKYGQQIFGTTELNSEQLRQLSVFETQMNAWINSPTSGAGANKKKEMTNAEKIQNLWNSVLEIEKSIISANENFKTVFFKEKDSHDRIFYAYEHDGFIRHAKTILIEETIRLASATIENFSIPFSVNQKFIDDSDFNAEEIIQYVHANYVCNAKKLAYENILNTARELLPIVFRDHKRVNPEITDILKNRSLKLRFYFPHYQGYKYIIALDQLVKIELLNENAAQVRTTLYRSIDFQIQAGKKYIYDSPIIEWFKIYKNGNIEFQFKERTDALKIAETLLRTATDADGNRAEDTRDSF